jgi:hypothetical protein
LSREIHALLRSVHSHNMSSIVSPRYKITVSATITSKGPNFFVPSSPPRSVEAGRQRVTHLQAGTAQSGLYVRF